MRATIFFLLAVVLAACTSSGSEPARTSSPAVSGSRSSAPSTGASSAPKAQLYVSIGDSYAAGYQPRVGTNTHGFAYQVVSLAKAKGYDLRLTNFGCSGATTTSIITRPGCAQRLRGPGAPAYDGKTQAAAAEAFLRAHQGQVGLVTVSIGGNDITACGFSADALACLTKALATAKANLATLLTGLRAAAGPSTRIVGLTYPDVLLGNYLSKDANVKALAEVSTVAFQQFVNPALKAAYAAVGAAFVDVTAATGAYGSFSQTTTLAPYGTIPVPVAQVCRLTYYCDVHDIHPRTVGYALIARLVVATLPPG